MNTAQQHLAIEDIKDNLIFLKDGSVSLILSTTAVNFGLLSDLEQTAIIEAFAGLLNSLSFPLEIVIRSERLNISSYLGRLDEALKMQNNPLLIKLIQNYRGFVQSLIKENQVLDKQFYVVIGVTGVELGVLPKSLTEKTQKALTILGPRRENIIHQLANIGLKAKQLTTVELIKLFYGIYNQPGENGIQNLPAPTQVAPSTVLPSVQPPTLATTQTPVISRIQVPIRPPVQADQATLNYQPTTNYPPTLSNLSPPFVVEELADDYGS
ncbi:hypothetical protein HY389_02160 [Candidatus Daviesbacteria bacterium]|nr:hypothetical protein [Candidatus Daviesbacteria bacterium]